MPFHKPTLQELVDRIQADLESRLGLTSTDHNSYSNTLRRSVTGVLSQVQAGASYLLLGYLDFLSRQVMIDTAEKDYLRRWAQVWGVQEKPATFAQGYVVFKGEENAVIPAETCLRRQDGVEFYVKVAASITQGSAAVFLEALLLGANGNTPAGTVLSLISPLQGVQLQVIVSESGLSGGINAELDESLRKRLLKRIQQPPQGGSLSDYEQWALQVPGVQRAWVYPGYFGSGTVGVTFLVDDAIPTQVQVAEVQKHLDVRRPVTAEVLVFSPSAILVPMTISAASLTITLQATIESDLRTWFMREAYPGMILHANRLQDVISQAAQGNEDYVLLSPESNVNYLPSEMPLFGGITWKITP